MTDPMRDPIPATEEAADDLADAASGAVDSVKDVAGDAADIARDAAERAGEVAQDAAASAQKAVGARRLLRAGWLAPGRSLESCGLDLDVEEPALLAIRRCLDVDAQDRPIR